MKSEETLALPDFLADLGVAFMGHRLQCFRSKLKPYTHHVALDDSQNGHRGFYFNLKQQTAVYEHRDYNYSYADYTASFEAPSEGQETAEAVLSFEEWVRNWSSRILDDQVMWTADAHFKWRPRLTAKDWERMNSFFDAFSEFPEFQFTHRLHNGLLHTALRVLYRAHQTGSLTDADFVELLDFFENYNELTVHRDLVTSIEYVAFHFLPDSLPQCFVDFFTARHTPKFESFWARFELNQNLDDLSHFARRVATYPVCLRRIYHQHLCSALTNPFLLHAAASAFSEHPAEALEYIERGLEFAPDDLSILVVARTIYVALERFDDVERTTAKLAAAGLDEPAQLDTNDNIQAWIDRYTFLCSDFYTFSPSTNALKTGPELLELENKLNQHWYDVIQNAEPIMRMGTASILIRMNRFLSAGTGSYFGWLRNQKRYQEVVDGVLVQMENIDLCHYRHMTSASRFEKSMSNALSSFLDSQEPKHIVQAVEVVDRLEKRIRNWEDGNVLYTLACIMSRANQLDRAMGYVNLALAKGERVSEMASDSDFTNILSHPPFMALMAC